MQFVYSVQEPPKKWIDFFLAFQRFEYALKRHPRFLKTTREGARAEASWDAFGEYLGPDFFARVQTMKLAEEIFQLPPGKELVGDNGKCVFGKRIMPKKSYELFGAIRIIRNNLFHGGKSEFTERNHNLIRDAMNVLNEALASCDEVRTTFLEYTNEMRPGF